MPTIDAYGNLKTSRGGGGVVLVVSNDIVRSGIK